MKKIDIMYDEIFKLASIIDKKWEDIISRNDDGVNCGKYIIRKQFSAHDDGYRYYWRITIEEKISYMGSNDIVLSFFKRGGTDFKGLCSYDNIILTTLSDDVMIIKENKFNELTDMICTIPYDKTSSIEERKFSVELLYDNENIREVLLRTIELQHMGLKNIDVVFYKFDKFVDLTDGIVYNTISQRPFFKNC